jgi:DNA repair exonuclease SbcCD ATPase subunit
VETLVVLMALLVAAVAGWIARDRTLAQLLRRSDIDRNEAIEKAESLANALQDEKVARATAEAMAKQVTPLETELVKLRLSQQQLIREKAEFETATARVPALEAALNTERERVVRLTADMSRLEAEHRKQQEAFDEKEAALTTLRGEIENQIKTLASDALKGNQDTFLKLANEVFEKHRETSASKIEQRKDAIKTLLGPLAATVEKSRKNLSEIPRTPVESQILAATSISGFKRWARMWWTRANTSWPSWR